MFRAAVSVRSELSGGPVDHALQQPCAYAALCGFLCGPVDDGGHVWSPPRPFGTGASPEDEPAGPEAVGFLTHFLTVERERARQTRNR